MTPESPIPSSGTNPMTPPARPDQPLKIFLDEAPKTPLSASSSPYLLGSRVELPSFPGYEDEVEPELPSRLASAKKFISKGYFDPFNAFADEYQVLLSSVNTPPYFCK